MPGYPFLAKQPIDFKRIGEHLGANRMVGVPYSDEMIANATADALAQANPDSDGIEALAKRYGKVQVRDFDGNPNAVSELDALIAYLQMLGTLVDFSVFKAAENFR